MVTLSPVVQFSELTFYRPDALSVAKTKVTVGYLL